MKVKTLLAQAEKCKTSADAAILLQALAQAFGATKALGHLQTWNEDYSMEGDQPYVKFELNHVISERYITCISPEIRHGKLVVIVVTNHMLDGLGMQSQSWEVVEGLDDDVIETEDDQTITAVANKAKTLALANHTELIERVGVVRKQAQIAARRSW